MEWIRLQLALAGETQADLGDAIGLTSVQVNKILCGIRSLKAAEADRIRKHFGYELPEDRPSAIAVVGRVGAGDHVELFDDHAKGAGLYNIGRPDWVPAHNVAAAEVSGSSAEPWTLEGDIIFWRRNVVGVLEEDLGRPVIAEIEDGRVVLKRLGVGQEPGLWSLYSLNPNHPNIIGVRLVWAARVLAPLPRDQIRFIDP